MKSWSETQLWLKQVRQKGSVESQENTMGDHRGPRSIGVIPSRGWSVNFVDSPEGNWDMEVTKRENTFLIICFTPHHFSPCKLLPSPCFGHHLKNKTKSYYKQRGIPACCFCRAHWLVGAQMRRKLTRIETSTGLRAAVGATGRGLWIGAGPAPFFPPRPFLFFKT